MLIGYEWISDADSHAVREEQHQALLNAGVDASCIYSDTDSPQEQRTGLQACLNTMQSGDTLVVWQLDRLAIDRSHLVVLLKNLWQRSIGIKVLTGQGAVLDTTRLDLKLVIDLIAALDELEVQVLRKRTIRAHAAVRERGELLGPPRKMTASLLRQAMKAMTESNRSLGAIAAEIGVTRATLYNYLNGDGSPKPAGQRLLMQQDNHESSE